MYVLPHFTEMMTALGLGEDEESPWDSEVLTRKCKMLAFSST